MDKFTDDYSRFVGESEYNTLDTRRAYKRGYQDGHARGLADGLERAAEMVFDKTLPNDHLGKLIAKALRDEAAKIRGDK